jgi:hypothetical protein
MALIGERRRYVVSEIRKEGSNHGTRHRDARRTLKTVAALGLTVLMAACDGGGRSPVSPTPAIPTPPPGPTVGGTLSGVVFELNAGQRAPVEGVEVYCDSCGPQGHTFSITDGSGAYRLEGAPYGRTTLLLAKPGYGLLQPGPLVVFGGWMGSIDAFVAGETQFDVEVVRR